MGINYIVLSLADAVPLLDCGRRTKPHDNQTQIALRFRKRGKNPTGGATWSSTRRGKSQICCQREARNGQMIICEHRSLL